MTADSLLPPPPPGRGVYANRTLNLRGVQAVGYDMDYTLVHYRVEEWEQRAYETTRRKLLERGWPVEHLAFRPELVIRGLAIDTELGNLVKANRFGFIKQAAHGTRLLSYEELRRIYQRSLVDLGDKRFTFLNTLFSLSEGCLYAQLVELLDEGRLPGVLGYADLMRQVGASLNETHIEGELKAEVAADPDRFIVLDPDLPQTLIDQREAGKKLLLITNSEWTYTEAVLTHVLTRHLPGGGTWRDLFDLVIVGARKPAFFFEREAPLFEVVDPTGLLRPCVRGLSAGALFQGGCARQVEKHLGLSGDQILYVGDHLLSDVHAASKSMLRWRTALVLRELETEIVALRDFRERERQLERLMAEKAVLEQRQARLRLAGQRQGSGEVSGSQRRAAQDVRDALTTLDQQIAPLAQSAAALGNERWGLLLRTGNDKSLLARQLERHADVYTSRVSNFMFQTPYGYLRSVRGILPHDVDA